MNLPPETSVRVPHEAMQAFVSEAYLPGGPEAARERVYRESGIPVGPEHQTRLEKLGTELGIAVPW